MWQTVPSFLFCSLYHYWSPLLYRDDAGDDGSQFSTVFNEENRHTPLNQTELLKFSTHVAKFSGKIANPSLKRQILLRKLQTLQLWTIVVSWDYLWGYVNKIYIYTCTVPNYFERMKRNQMSKNQNQQPYQSLICMVSEYHRYPVLVPYCSLIWKMSLDIIIISTRER